MELTDTATDTHDHLPAATDPDLDEPHTYHQDAYQEDDQIQQQAQAQLEPQNVSGSEFGDEDIPEPEQSDYDDDLTPPPKRAGRTSTRRAPPKKRAVEEEYQDDGSEYESDEYNGVFPLSPFSVSHFIQLEEAVQHAVAPPPVAESTISFNSTAAMVTTRSFLCVAIVVVCEMLATIHLSLSLAQADSHDLWCPISLQKKSYRSATKSLPMSVPIELKEGGLSCIRMTKTTTPQNVATTLLEQDVSVPITFFLLLSLMSESVLKRLAACLPSLLFNTPVSTWCLGTVVVVLMTPTP